MVLEFERSCVAFHSLQLDYIIGIQGLCVIVIIPYKTSVPPNTLLVVLQQDNCIGLAAKLSMQSHKPITTWSMKSTRLIAMGFLYGSVRTALHTACQLFGNFVAYCLMSRPLT